MTATIIDASLDAIVWEELAPNCESNDHRGGMETATYIDNRACPCHVLKCDGCAARDRADMDKVAAWQCGYCETVWGLGRLREFFEVVPL